MTAICNHCRQPLARHETRDTAVMRPVHKSCYAARLAAVRLPTWGSLTQIAPMARRMGVRLR